MWPRYRINTDQNIRIPDIKIIDKSEKMVSQEDNVVTEHAFTELLKWRDYINNAILLQ